MLSYSEIIERRRSLAIPGYKTLAEVGFEGPWVSPYQISSRSMTGPVFVALHWLDEPTIVIERDILMELGFLPRLRFNKVMDLALSDRGLTRNDVYVTQAFHLIPPGRSGPVPTSALLESFREVTAYELEGRNVIALGNAAAASCNALAIPHKAVCNPSRRGFTNHDNAAEIINAIAAFGY